MAARGRYIAFLDSDDFFLEDKLATCRAYFAKCDVPAIYSQVLVDRGVGRMWTRPETGIGPTDDVGEYLFVHNQIIQTSSIVITREAATRTLFDPDLRKGQDLDFCIRLQHDGVRFVMLTRPLVVWTDVSNAGRTSHIAGHAAPLAWLEKSRPLLTRRAYLGYRATVLAYYIGRVRPLTCAVDLIRALVEARVPARIIARQALRAYLPRAAYRTLVNWIVARRGVDEKVMAGAVRPRLLA